MSICERLVSGLSDYFLLLSSVRDDLVTDDGNQALSARQGMILKNLVDSKIPVIVESASVKVCEEEDVPVEGYQVGDRYIDFQLNTGEEEHIYILADEIIRVITSYEALTNLPSINNVTLTGNKSTSDLLIDYDDLTNKPLIPENTSELNNDSDFITSNYHDDTKVNTADLSTLIRNEIKDIFVGRVAKVSIVDGNLRVRNYEASDFGPRVPLYAPAFDGTEIINVLGGNVTAANGVLTSTNKGYGILTAGFDNGDDWQLTCEVSLEKGGFAITTEGNRKDYNELGIWTDSPNNSGLNCYNNGSNINTLTFSPSLQTNTWIDFSMKKIGNTVTYGIEGQETSYTWAKLRTSSRLNVMIKNWGNGTTNMVRNLVVNSI